MRRILTLLATLCLAVNLNAQTDISVPWVGPFGDIGRRLLWGVSGRGGINNAFIIDLPAPQTCACVFIRNLGGAGHSFKFRAYTTNDQAIHSYYTNPDAWEPLTVAATRPDIIPAGGWYAVSSLPAASGLVVFSVTPGSGGRIAIVIGESTAAGDAADIYYSFGSPSPCSAYIPADSYTFVDRETITADATVSWIGAPASASGLGAVYAAAPQEWSVCSFELLTVNTAGTTPTLNVYIQAFNTFQITVDDRVSFTQVTTGTLRQGVTLVMDAPVAPHTTLDHTLAAGSTAGGSLWDTVKVYYDIAGTAGPSYSVTLMGVCH